MPSEPLWRCNRVPTLRNVLAIGLLESIRQTNHAVFQLRPFPISDPVERRKLARGELANTFYMEDRIYPAFSLVSLIAAPLVLLLGTQLAGLLATLRIRRLRPVTAMRAE